MNLLEQLAGQEQPQVAPLCLDPLMARIAEESGFSIGYVSGGALGYSYAVSEALLTTTEIADCTRRITQRSEIGMIVDVGVGFGDAVHAVRGVWELEQAGAIAIEIEDQVAPKQVSHHRGIEHLVPVEEMVGKIAQVVKARRGDMAVIARTGAVKNESFAAAMSRLKAYQAAGADVLMLTPEGDEHIRCAREELQGPLACITSMDHATKPRWQASGWDLIIDPFTAQVLSVQVVETAYRNFITNGNSGTDLKALFANYAELAKKAGLDELYAIEDSTTQG